MNGYQSSGPHVYLQCPANKLSLSRKTSITVGTTSVTVKADILRPNSVFVLCGIDFCRLEFSSRHSLSPTVYNIWLTDRIRVAYQQKSMQTVTQVEYQRHLETSGMIGSVVCISGTELIMAALDDESGPGVVPRRLRIGGTPTRIIFSKHLNKLVVSYTTLEMRPISQGNGHGRSSGKRSLRPTIQIIDPDQDSIKTEPETYLNHEMDQSDSVRSVFPVGKPGERILGMLGSRSPAHRTQVGYRRS